MMVRKQIYDESLDRFYKAIDKNYDDRNSTKKWCFTLWLATIGFSGNYREQVGYLPAVCLSYVPIITFWFMEATQGAFGKILIDKALEMEMLLLREWEGITSREEYLYISGRHASMRVKVHATLHAAFFMETVVTFYVLLGAIGPALIFFMRAWRR